MSDYKDSNAGTMPPLADSGQYSPQVLTGTGTTEASNSRALSKDRMHVLSVGLVPVRVLFGSAAGGGSDVPPAGGVVLAAASFFTFRASVSAAYVYVEAADGAATYEAAVWQRER